MSLTHPNISSDYCNNLILKNESKIIVPNGNSIYEGMLNPKFFFIITTIKNVTTITIKRKIMKNPNSVIFILVSVFINY